MGGEAVGERLKPFFTYFGGKWRIAQHYPAPRFVKVVEPFAGSAGYALHYPDREVSLYEIDPKIYGVWDYLIKVKPSEIRALPARVASVDPLPLPQEARWLIGFWLNKGTSQPSKTPSRWMRDGLRPNSFWGEAIRERVASQVGAIKHWRVFNKSYEAADPRKATWFVDPPYVAAGKGYKFHAVDYAALAKWCRARQGQVIVCEAAGATWLPFKPFRSIKTLEGAHGRKKGLEVIWTNPSPPHLVKNGGS